MIVEVLGYKFPNKQIADDYVAVVDARYGFPNGDTLHYFEPIEGVYESVSFWWTSADDKLIADLGQPYTFYIDNGL